MIYRTHGFCDCLVFTIPISQEYWQIASANLDAAISRGSIEKILRRRGPNNPHQLYWSSARFPIPGRDSPSVNCFIQYNPTVVTRGFLRIDFNPAKASTDSIIHILEILSQYIPDLMNAWPNAMITRVDIAVDVHNMSIDEMLAFSKSGRTQLRKYTDNGGQVSGYYLGAIRSIRRLLVYDKAFETFCRQNAVRQTTSVMRFSTPITRIEFRLKEIGRFSNLHRLHDGIHRFGFASVRQAIRLSQERWWHLFISECVQIGAQDVLRDMVPARRSHAQRVLRGRCTPSWFDMTSIAVEGGSSALAAVDIDRQRLSLNTPPPH